jgi:thiamine biosynthesis lipoprotein ApbE
LHVLKPKNGKRLIYNFNIYDTTVHSCLVKNLRVFLRFFSPYEDMAIGFGAIGKGYAANMAKKAMMEAGAISSFVDASGDILFWGNNANDAPWKVTIQ